MINNRFSSFLFPHPPPGLPKWDTTSLFGESPRGPGNVDSFNFLRGGARPPPPEMIAYIDAHKELRSGLRSLDTFWTQKEKSDLREVLDFLIGRGDTDLQ
jgi:hypothetical protein